jgi:nucleoside-diphosphate-sugar epimerase
MADQIEFIAGDVRDAALVDRACAGVDAVCHLAFVNGTEFFYTKPELVLDVGVRGMINVLDGCRHHDVGELILASSSEVYQTPAVVPTDETVALSIPDVHNPRYSYSGAKIISEIMALNYGRKHFHRVIIFRPHNVYGPQMGWEHVVPQFIVRMTRLAQDLPAGVPVRFPIRGDGTATRSFVYIDDFTQGVWTAIQRGEHLNIYHIGTDEEVSVAQVAEKVGRCLGRQVVVVPRSPVPGETPRRCPDIRKICNLGYHARVAFDQGLERTVAWYRNHMHLAPPDTLELTGDFKR